MQKTKMKIIIWITGFIVTLGITACDPGHRGTASIDNQSSESFILHYQTRYKDTSIVIPSETKKVVLNFGGIGEGRSYPGALIEFSKVELTPTDTTRKLIKNIKVPENWEMINRNKRRFSSKPIDCWFTVTNNDIE